MPINGRIRGIDFCIADIVAALNAANITTIASCCGHGVMDGDIRLEDGRVLTVKHIALLASYRQDGRKKENAK